MQSENVRTMYLPLLAVILSSVACTAGMTFGEDVYRDPALCTPISCQRYCRDRMGNMLAFAICNGDTCQCLGEDYTATCRPAECIVYCRKQLGEALLNATCDADMCRCKGGPGECAYSQCKRFCDMKMGSSLSRAYCEGTTCRCQGRSTCQPHKCRRMCAERSNGHSVARAECTTQGCQCSYASVDSVSSECSWDQCKAHCEERMGSRLSRAYCEGTRCGCQGRSTCQPQKCRQMCAERSNGHSVARAECSTRGCQCSYAPAFCRLEWCQEMCSQRSNGRKVDAAVCTGQRCSCRYISVAPAPRACDRGKCKTYCIGRMGNSLSRAYCEGTECRCQGQGSCQPGWCQEMCSRRAAGRAVDAAVCTEQGCSCTFTPVCRIEDCTIKCRNDYGDKFMSAGCRPSGACQCSYSH